MTRVVLLWCCPVGTSTNFLWHLSTEHRRIISTVIVGEIEPLIDTDDGAWVRCAGVEVRVCGRPASGEAHLLPPYPHKAWPRVVGSHLNGVARVCREILNDWKTSLNLTIRLRKCLLLLIIIVHGMLVWLPHWDLHEEEHMHIGSFCHLFRLIHQNRQFTACGLHGVWDINCSDYSLLLYKYIVKFAPI